MAPTTHLNRRSVLKGIAGASLVLPVLEAMGHGTPVVTSTDTATAEVAGDAGLVVDATDVEAVADGLRRVLNDPALAVRLAEAGRDRAATLTWAATAEAMVGVYREVLGR